MDFKIDISIPPDNPPIAQVDHAGVEYPSIQFSKQDKFIQILDRAKHQKEIEQIKLNDEKNESIKDQEKEKEKQQLVQQQLLLNKPNPMIAFHEHKNMARIELEQLIFLIDMLRSEQIALNNTEKPKYSKESEKQWDQTHIISHKQQSLKNVASRLKLGATKMKETISTMSGWWNDVSQLRTKWRLKGKDQVGISGALNSVGGGGGGSSTSGGGGGVSPMQGLNNKSNSKKLSIDYGYYTSGSLMEQTDADLSRGPNGEINIDFPHLPNQQSVNKRLYINVKSSDSKTFYNHSSNLKKLLPLVSNFSNQQPLTNNNRGGTSVNTPKTPTTSTSTSSSSSSSAFSKLRQQHQLLQQQQQQLLQLQSEGNPDNPEEIHRKFILNTTNQLNKAQKYQFNHEIFEQLSKEVASLNISSSTTGGGIGVGGGGGNLQANTQTSPNIPSNITGGAGASSNIIGSLISNQGSLSLTTSTSGENIMLTEKEIRIECGNFNLFIGMDIKNKDDDNNNNNNNNSNNINNNNEKQSSIFINCNSNNNNSKNIIFSDQEKNRLLVVLKTILKKISILQLKRSQKQLTMNLSRRTPKIIFGKKSIIGHNDEVIFKITSIIKHMDTYLRVYKVLEIFEQKLPIRLKSTPAAESASSLFILTLIDSSQNLKNPMVPIEISIDQNKIEVIQGQNRSFTNKDEVILGSFIINLLKSYFINNNIHPSYLDISGFDENDVEQPLPYKSSKKYKFSNNQSLVILIDENDGTDVVVGSSNTDYSYNNCDNNNNNNNKSNRQYQIEKFFKNLVDDISSK